MSKLVTISNGKMVVVDDVFTSIYPCDFMSFNRKRQTVTVHLQNSNIDLDFADFEPNGLYSDYAEFCEYAIRNCVSSQTQSTDNQKVSQNDYDIALAAYHKYFDQINSN